MRTEVVVAAVVGFAWMAGFGGSAVEGGCWC